VIERPILFSGPMVRAILDGRKTQTRRIVSDDHARFLSGEPVVGPHLRPYAKVGDRLWVREAWAPHPEDEQDPAERICYRADGSIWGPAPHGTGSRRVSSFEEDVTLTPPRWRPSIHMPRWASRLSLEVTGVRVERLQEITPADATAEGITWEPGTPWTCSEARKTTNARVSLFADLWDSVNEGRSTWATNPWVWVVEFTRAGGAA